MILPDTDRPAIAGGEKAKKTPYGSQVRYGEDELNELREALEQNTLFYAQGKKVRQLEEEFAAKHGVKWAVACSSGTTGIHTALTALGIAPGDEVIVPPITDMGTIAPVLYQGAVPVFADLLPHSYALDPASVEAAVTDRTRAIIAVHLWGNPCDLDALDAICKRHNLLLIEDCAQAFGATWKGRPVGAIGSVGCYSYNEFKHISCGDGGVVVTGDADVANRLRLSTDKCYDRRPDALIRQPVFLANNYRMTELQGAVARAQLRKLDGIVARRRAWCESLLSGLADTPGIALPEPTPGGNPSWWFFLLRVAPYQLGGATADDFAAALAAEGVRASAHYIGTPIYRYPLFQDHSAYAEHGENTAYARYDYSATSCPVAEAILETGVMLPVNEAFTETDAAEIVFAVRRVACWFSRQGRNEAA